MNYQEYEEIINVLQNGTEKDWEQLTQEISDFPNGCDYLGRAWIINAIDLGSLLLVKWILSKKVDLCFVDPEGYSVLHSCIDRELPDKYEIMQLLIDNGADINIGSKLDNMAINGWTPLHMAAYRNDLQIIKILLQNGADTTLKTIIDNYYNAEQEALLAGNKQAAEIIKTYKQSKK